MTIWKKKTLLCLTIEMRRIPHGSTLVDLGAGEQDFREIYKNYHVTKVDIHPYEGIDIVADFEKPMPFADKKFEVALSTNTLEHLYKPLFYLQETHRILKNGGILLGSVPYHIQPHQIPHDYHRYTSYAINRYLQDAGFSEIRIVPIGKKREAVLYSIKLAFRGLKKMKATIIKKVISKLLYYEKLLEEPSINEPLGYFFTAVKR